MGESFIIKLLIIGFIGMAYSYFKVLIKLKKCENKDKKINQHYILGRNILKYLFIISIIITLVIFIIDLLM
jgi:hypothetical protein